jgi:hypothetical protein
LFKYFNLLDANPPQPNSTQPKINFRSERWFPNQRFLARRRPLRARALPQLFSTPAQLHLTVALSLLVPGLDARLLLSNRLAFRLGAPLSPNIPETVLFLLPKIEAIKAAITARGIPSSELIRQFGFNCGRKATKVHRFVALVSQVATIDRDPYWVHLKDTPILPPNIEDVKAAIPAEGIDLTELCHKFGYNGTPGTTTFIPLVRIVAETHRITKLVHLKDPVVPLPTFEEIMAAIPEEGIAARELTRRFGFSATRDRAACYMFIDLVFIVAKFNSVTHSVYMKKDFTKPRGALRDRDGAKQWLANII